MKTKTYQRTHGKVIVEEMGRREFGQMAADIIEGIIDCGDDDTSVYIRYRNGKVFTCSLADGTEGNFSKVNIDFGCITNAATYQVVGEYVIDENGICNAAE